MELTNESAIREFLTKISSSCIGKDCKICPLYLKRENGEPSLSACLFVNKDPEKWNVYDIIERYKKL